MKGGLDTLVLRSPTAVIWPAATATPGAGRRVRISPPSGRQRPWLWPARRGKPCASSSPAGSPAALGHGGEGAGLRPGLRTEVPRRHPDQRHAAHTDLLGERNLRVINGAGNSGLMCAVSDAALAAGGTVTGVIPRFMVEQDWCHKGLTDLVEVDSMHERKQRMADLSDAVIALPGGCGTLEELLEVITWKQLGLYLNPIVILNINGYFDPLLEMFRRAVDEHFMRPQHAALWTVASTPAEAVGLIFSEPVWDANIRKLALV